MIVSVEGTDYPDSETIPVLAVLEIAPIETGAIVIDEFCNRFIYFYSGFAFAWFIKKYAETLLRQPFLSAALVASWIAVTATYVLIGFSKLPGISLLLGMYGSLALIALAAWCVKFKWHRAFAICGRNSLVIYLAFFLPMAVAREALVNSGIIASAGLVSLAVTITAVIAPLLFYELIKRTGYGLFLFRRPAFAHLPGTHSPEGLRHSI
ncbi:MAG: acyltransferase family protein [Pseudomonadota bacterium]